MKNKGIAVLLTTIILLAATLFVITKSFDSPSSNFSVFSSTENISENTDTGTSDKLIFDDTANDYTAPQTNTATGAVTTQYEPVYPVNIGSEGVKNAVTLHSLVSSDARAVYSEILSALKNAQKDIILSSPVNEDVFLRALIYVRDFNPELFFVDWSQYNYKTTSDNKVAEVIFTFLYDDVRQRSDSLESAVSAIVSQANRYPNLFERELFVHDYLVNNVTYLVDDGDTGTAYGALINKKARCEGYARAFQLIMLRIGVPTVSVIGNAENERHMWNAVNLYGKYYFVDVTFDDNSGDTATTLYRENEISHSCFNIPSEILTKTHTVSESASKDRYGAYQNLFLPECNSYDFNYYRIRGLMVENDNQFKYLLQRNLSEKRLSIFFKGQMPSSEHFQSVFRSFYGETYSSGGYSLYYTPDGSPVFNRNVFEISWTVG